MIHPDPIAYPSQTISVMERGRRRTYPVGPVVYFVSINNYVKIGFSTNLKSRMKTFRTSCPDTQILLTIPGGRELERRLHVLLQEQCIEREMYRLAGRVADFLDINLQAGFDRAMVYLEESGPAERARHRQEDHLHRIAEERKTKADKDAYFAALVAERKQKLGW